MSFVNFNGWNRIFIHKNFILIQFIKNLLDKNENVSHCILILFHILLSFVNLYFFRAQSAGRAEEYTDCISAKG